MRKYDCHHCLRFFNQRVVAKFIEKTGETVHENVEIIGLNLERFISFEFLYLRFVDSMQFLNGSLESLVDTLAKSCITSYDNLFTRVDIWVIQNYYLPKAYSHMIFSTPSTSLMIRNYHQKTPFTVD
jgi:hypothetical protein